MPIITTAQMSITDPDALDITVKSASTPEGRALAPTWPMVNASKSGAITWGEYRERYLVLLRGRYADDPSAFMFILSRERVVLKCYCPAGANCHRHIAAEVLAKIAAHHDITVTREPEIIRPTPPDQPTLFDLPDSASSHYQNE